MSDFSALLRRLDVASPFSFEVSRTPAHRLDLSRGNAALAGFDAADTAAFGQHIARAVEQHGVWLAVGGYGEDRTLYAMSRVFGSAGEAEPRTLHLGVDLWLPAGMTVHAVLGGTVHSTQDNHAFGDYGPTVILEHEAAGERFHTLYGHLARRTLDHVKPGQRLAAGEHLGWLGEPQENVGWPPHLHFQVIRDLEGRRGDYPGVCRVSEAARWLANCPDPNLLLRIPALDD
jgi:murein DD-endopeptidase MepM/ murein hydrolase activator NlpD